jgi:mannitol-1-/sugar-/sorbitol-6-/2-deoxyglucose-6-phosphatase
VSVVIFDLDGVLVESEPYWQAGFADIVNAFAGDSGWTPPGLKADQMGAYQGGRVDETLREILTKLEHSETAMDESLVHDLTHRVIDHASTAFLDHPTPIPVSVAAAKELHARGHTIGVASSSAPEFIDTALEVTGLDGLVAARQSALGLARGKPDPEVYLLLLRQVGVQADQCVAIEDSEKGIGAAVAAGIPCIGLRRHGEPLERFDRCVWVTDRLDADEVEGVLSGRLRRGDRGRDMG